MTIALAIPSAVWLPERAALLDALRPQLSSADHYLELVDREHWSQWAIHSWEWAVDTGADWFLSLQDDVELAPHFWPALRAMMSAWPKDVIALAATHSLAREVARTGRRSYLSGRIVGWGWAMPVPLVRELLAWAHGGALEQFRAEFPKDGEDTFVGLFLAARSIVPRSPVPTIVDHLHVASTNEGFDNHTHRRSVVTWRGYEPADMVVPSWWLSTCTRLPPDDWRRCWWCGERPEAMRSATTGALLCMPCLATLVLSKLGVRAEAR